MLDRRCRTALAVVAGAALLIVGSGIVTTAPASAAPSAPDPNYPLGSEHGPQDKTPQEKQAEQAPEKAGKLGLSTLGSLLELGEDVVKCGINIATPAVKCPMD